MSPCFAVIKERLPANTPHKDVMRELSVQWKSGGNTTGGTGGKTRGGRGAAGRAAPDAPDSPELGGMRALKL